MGNLTALGRTMYDGSGAEEHTEAYAYQYDNWGRLQNTTHALDGGMPVTLTNNTYDSVGRLNGTTRGAIGATQGPASLSSSYAYNVRDWLTGIGGSLFSETLTYETPRTGSTLLGQWGGNISSSKWRIDPLSSDATWYDYAYDPLGRLTEAAYGSDVVSQNDYSRTYSYDLNGNPNGRETASYSEQWTAASGNAPAARVRTRTSPFSILLQEGYAYDAAGNRTAVLDALGDTLNVTAYNLLNLPKEYVASAGDVVKYVYSADGEKLYVQQTTSANVSTGTEYAANYRLEDGSLTMIHTDAGYYTPVTPPSGAGNPTYEHIWYLKDHLGNNRVLADGNGNSIAVNDYDPFGESIQVASSSGVNPFPLGATESPYKYGGKEWNEWTSTYDFEARYHSPGFHRFTTMDPLAEKYYSISPYAYCANNPVNLVDKDGTIFTDRSSLFVERYLNEINTVFLEAFKKKMAYQMELNKEGLSKFRIRNLNKRIEKQDDIMSEMLAAGLEMMLLLNDTSVATISHELKHAFQFEQGETGFDTKTGLGSRLLHDYNDEVSAFKRGSYFGGQSTPSSSYKSLSKNMNSINQKTPPAILQAIANSRGIIFRVFGKTYIGNDNASQLVD